MSTEEQARKSMAESRHNEQHLQETMLNRAEEKLEQSGSKAIEKEARERLVESRQHDKHVQQSMLTRSEEEILEGES
ncbi:hypothetical protein STA3757_45460 [Stanieria sp. NIES-3757]|nr:hypothetical protein STA3757_45460 [Stanieria sp. NIES-3757]